MAINLINNTPPASSTDVVLQTNIVLTFDNSVISGSVTDDTFVIYSEGQTRFRDVDQALPYDSDNSYNYTDYNYLEGRIEFSDDCTVVTFVPEKVLTTNTTYTVMVAGYDTGATDGKYVRSQDSSYLTTTYKWTFTTGVLNVSAPPAVSEEINYDELIREFSDITGTDITTLPSGQAVCSPSNGSFNVRLVNDTLFTFTSPSDIDITTVEPTVYLVSIEDPLKEKYQLPCYYELDGTRILKIKFA